MLQLSVPLFFFERIFYFQRKLFICLYVWWVKFQNTPCMPCVWKGLNKNKNIPCLQTMGVGYHIYKQYVWDMSHFRNTLDKSREQDAWWIAAMMEELSNLYPYLLKNKPYHSNGSPPTNPNYMARKKGRWLDLLPRATSQRKGVDFDEGFAPFAKWHTT